MAEPIIIKGFRVVADPALLNKDELPDISILEDLTRNDDIIGFYADTLGEWPVRHASLMDLASNHGLFVAMYSSGRLSSGLSAPRTLEILEKDAAFALFFKEIETRFHINNMWVTAYSTEARGPPPGPGGIVGWHTDKKYRGLHRMIVTLGAVGKIMWFRRGVGTKRVGIHATHNMAIALTSVGGGYSGHYQHAVTAAANSWTIITELALNK
jgi:hypothetical protein